MQTIEIKKTSDEAKKERTYPYMGITQQGYIVWFIKPESGIAIKHHDKDMLFIIYNSWIESLFTPMQGDYTFTFNND